MNQEAQIYIGRQVSHFEKIEISKIKAQFSKDMLYRYRLILPFIPDEKRTKRASIILKNPSSADIFRADKTVQTAAKTIYSAFKDVKELEILNIFALRGTLPSDVMDFHNKGFDIIGPNNDENIKIALENSDYLVIAWGGASPINKKIYDKRIEEIFSIINNCKNNLQTYRKLEKGNDKYPFHACYWPINEKFIQI